MKAQAAAVLSATLFGGAHAATYAQANFGDSGSGLMGYIKVANGHVMVDLDFDAVNYTALGIEADCADGGLGWHMHTIWEHPNSVVDAYGGTNCGPGFTSGHFDPWFGCGGATANTECSNKGGCVDMGTYDCTPGSYAVDPYACEVGDWSGMFGKIEPTSGNNFTASYFSYWAPMYSDLAMNASDLATSVVIHCNSGARAFCAAFQQMTDAMTYDQPDPTTTNVFDFKMIAEDFMVQTDDAGYTAYIPESVYGATGACTEWMLTLNSNWTSTSHAGMGDSNCMMYTGMVFDPTHQCIEDSSSMYCTYDSGDMMSTRCGTDFMYSCDGFMCAAGDISGRVGNIDLSQCTGNNLMTDDDNNIICMLRLDDDLAVPQSAIGMDGAMSATLTCASDATNVYCAKLGEDTNSYDDDDDDDDSANGAAVFVAMLAAFISMIVN